MMLHNAVVYKEFLSPNFRHRYLSVVIVASISFAICFFSIGVGMCLARLEQTRLNMERDGMGATLAKKQTKV